MSPLIVIPGLAFFLSFFLHLLALRAFPRWGLLDFPQRYGLTRPRIPYPAGVLAIVTFLALTPLLFPFPPGSASLALIASVVLLGMCSFLDDRAPLPPLLRLAVQLCIGILLFLGGVRIYSLTNPLEQITGIPFLPLDSVLVGSLPVLSGVFTILWLLLTINALNWFDGIPGQVSALSTIAFLTIGLLSLSGRVNQPALALLALSLSSISVACFLFEIPQPKALQGDTGAMFFGLMIGVLTIYSGGKVATAFLVLGVPLIDVFFVVVRRLFRRQSPLKGDANDQHLHHRLLRKGWSPQKIILLTAGLGSAFGITALFLNTFEKFVAAILLFLIMLGLSVYSRP